MTGLLIVILFSCQQRQTEEASISNGDKIQSIDIFKMDCSIRAIQAVDEKTCYFAGSNGMYGYTKDAGANWFVDSLHHPDHHSLQFRSLSKTSDAWMILGVASPALLYRSIDEGKNWDLVYEEKDSLAFYDAMAFWDEQEGIAMGDPTDSCLSVIKTHDGGKTWKKLPCAQLPTSAKGEAAFAASNGNIALVGDHVWMVSGGVLSRVYHSADRGLNWEVFDTPIIQGQAMTGIFSCDFLNENEGYIFGGNWDKPEDNTANKAISNDGGKTWTLVNDSLSPGYRSSVQYLGKKGHMIAVGFPGVSYSTDFGHTWEELLPDDYFTARSFGNTVWMAGKNKIARMKLNEEIK